MKKEEFSVKLPTPEPERPRVPVVVRDFDVPISSLVVFLLKLTVAAIPAALVVGLVVLSAGTFLAILATGL